MTASFIASLKGGKMEGEQEKLGEAPEQEVRVWGLGLTNNKLDKIIELLDRNNFLTAKLESKIDKLLNGNN